MELIAIDKPDGGTAVMHYLADDVSDQAITNEVKKALGPYPWRRITASEYKAIRDARPTPAPQIAPDAPAADMHAALGVVVDALEKLQSKNAEMEAKLEAVIDASYVTDVRGD